jgi:uncharacterized lipoprotein
LCEREQWDIPYGRLTGRIFKASLSEQSHLKVSLSSHLVKSDIFFVMASNLERELLASDNETLASNLDQTSTQSSVSATHSTMNTTNTEQVFQQLGQFLDSKLVQKLASFKRSFDEREDLRASQLKTPKLRVRLNSKVIRFNMNSMWRR